MVFIWPACCTEEYIKKLLSMIMSRALQKASCTALSQLEAAKFGLWSWRNVGPSCSAPTRQLMVTNWLCRWASSLGLKGLFFGSYVQLSSGKRPIVIGNTMEQDLWGWPEWIYHLLWHCCRFERITPAVAGISWRPRVYSGRSTLK